ncbi:caspase family protein [Cellulomonas sp. ATA003]|uniref:caspase family protein n=1 Tax=Cellulomonas sp. ATA003 TaxID=3073064 RepID=UPI002872D1AD|nr:caspase family protein [Cellulomonas sp. ATA003]WNB87312.1 caspase family protein [Cellulomonas sp. ATA003]
MADDAGSTGGGSPRVGPRASDGGDRVALIVATGRYDDPKLQQLRAPAADAERLATVLAHPDVAGMTVQKVLDQPAHAIRRELHRFLSERRRTDLVVLYFSCHGLKDLDGSLHFAGTDTELGLLASTGVSAAFVNDLVDSCRSNRVVILLDCCYSGAFAKLAAKGDLAVGVQERLEGQGRVVMTASNAMEYAFENERLSMRAAAPSVFTQAILQGLGTGEADRDGDGRVSVDELYDYVYDHVRRVTPNQTPGLTAHLSGTLYLARTPGARVLDEPREQEQGRPRGQRRHRLRRWWARLPRRPRLAATVAVPAVLVVAVALLAWTVLSPGPGWTQVAPLPQPVEAAAVVEYRDRLYVIGGSTPAPSAPR